MDLASRSRSLSRLLMLCAEQNSALAGRIAHAHILKNDFQSDIFLTNSIVNMYAKCGRLREAKFEFFGIRERDVVSWNCLINGFCQHGRGLEVLGFFRSMIREGLIPNAFTFAGVFTSAANASAVREGTQAHGVALKTGNCLDMFVTTSLVSLYCKCGLLDDARQMFDEMPERNSVSWAAMISGYAARRCEDEVLKLFVSMMVEDTELNQYVFTSVLSAFAEPAFIKYGRLVHAVSLKTSLESHVSVGNALVTMYAKCGSLEDATRMFGGTSSRNAITWSAMITGFAQGERNFEALTLLAEMHSSGISPSEFTLVGVLNASSNIAALDHGKQIHAYMLKLGYASQVFVCSALIDMYAKCCSVHDARKGFDQLNEPDVVLWTSMISGYVQNGESEEALGLYGRMEVENILPNELTLSSVIKACSNLAALEQGRQMHARTVKYGLSMRVPIGSALSSMYAKCGVLEEGVSVFRRMKEKDVVCWNSMISGLSQNGRGKEALRVYEDMQLQGTEPDDITFVNLLSTCSHIGLVDEGWHYFKSMQKDHGIAPTVEHYACMVDILSRGGHLEDAQSFIESVPLEHGLVLWRILLGASRSHGNLFLGAYAGERLMELGSQESSAYVLLSNIYASSGRWKDVERVRSLMRSRGVNKEPGCSWIEIKNQVHVFVVRDQLHPQIKEVYFVLRTLFKQMRDEGYRPETRVVFSHFEQQTDDE